MSANFMPPCCMHNKLPELLRTHEGAMVAFYSQGDWGIDKLWNAASCMVQDTVQHQCHLLPTNGNVRMLLVVGVLDRSIVETVAQYLRRQWASHIMLVCHTTTLSPQVLQGYLDNIGSGLQLILGQRAAQQQSLWLRWNDATYAALLVHGPIFSHDSGNPTFATYTATLHDAIAPVQAPAQEPEQAPDAPAAYTFPPNPRGKALVEQVTQFWLTL